MPLLTGAAMRGATTTVALAFAAVRPCAAQGLLSEHAVAAQTIAGTTITVEYYRPAARGRDSLFGKVVTWGEHWTPGANWATTLEVDHPVRLNGALLPKGKYALWTVVEPDRWTVELRRRWRKFHVPPPTGSDDVQLRLTVRPDTGPATEVLTFDFPVVRPAATTLRFRWGTVVVPFEITALAPPLVLLRSPRDGVAYLGRYDLRLLMDDSAGTRRRLQVDILQAGDTLRWRDADGPEAERRDYVLSPAGRDEFTRARRAPDGQYWPDSAGVVSFTLEQGRATGLQLERKDGGTAARGTRER